jgi:hypothetical protein
MESLAELWRRLLFLFRRRQFDHDLEEEMRFHLEMKSRDSGLNAARRQLAIRRGCRKTAGTPGVGGPSSACCKMSAMLSEHYAKRPGSRLSSS